MRYTVRSFATNTAPPTRRRARGVIIIGALVALFAFVMTAEAHDFWLVPNGFQIAEGGTLEIRGQTSSRFPTSESAVALDRVAEAKLIGAAGNSRITDLSHRGTSLLLRDRPPAAGQYVVAVAIRPRSVRESAASFRRYLELEGAPSALLRIEGEGLLRGRDSVTRRYAKYAKAIVQVGRGGPRIFTRTAGHPLELVPVQDPAALGVGDTLAVRLIYRGEPLAGIRVHAGAVDVSAAGAASSDDARASTAESDVKLTSDTAGIVRIRLERAGLWNARTIHVVQGDANSRTDWDTHWATLVFGIGGDRRQPAESDSAAVARTIDRYHRALTEGDSAAALALLASDAIILESGGVETREEYRSHHLPGDIAFARALQSKRGPIRVAVQGDVAWASSVSTTQGEYRGRAMNSAGAELIVLSREGDGWKIRAIHWSSRTRR